MKKWIAFILIFAMMLPLTGCDMVSGDLPGFFDELFGVDGECKHDPGKLINPPKLRLAEVTLEAGSVIITCSCGEEIKSPDLEDIAHAKYDKKFEKCSNEEKMEVQRLYAISNNVHRNLAELYVKLNADVSTDSLDNWNVAEDSISQAGTAFSLIQLYGDLKDNDKIAKAFGHLNDAAGVTKDVLTIVQTIVYCKELSENKTSNPRFFAKKSIQCLKNITSPIDFGDYFSQCLDAIAVGMDMLIVECDQREQKIHATYDVSCDPVASGMLCAGNWTIVANVDWWDELGNHPQLTLQDIINRGSELSRLSETEQTYMKGYIVARLKYELAN